MRFMQSMICWNPGTDQVTVVPWPDTRPADEGLRLRLAASPDMDLEEAPRGWQIAILFIHFHTLVVRDCVPLVAAHRAFMEIDEYRQCMAPEIEGAEDVPEAEVRAYRSALRRQATDD
jgi:hypothetical protein